MALITSQDGSARLIASRIVAVTVHYWPQLSEGDPDVSYDVLAHTSADHCIGRFATLARAEEVRDAVAAAVDGGTDYEVPLT